MTDLRGIEVVGPAGRWAAATGAPLDGDTLRLDDATATFRGGPVEAVTTVLLEARADRELDLGGVRFVLRRPQP
ncbi:hypothetical protein LWC35_09750 [Pseudonocardia kujensis]|uniref:hypothetical protein n=1 Tax=Pseudonocardia kujensis TaxID=1128675 RepID=UPI001E530F97|nr:hypothetical protein [Pseudonocardia kujensis]MCE0763191.1 hypothetical protein [Pseudonocardia kujensis]